MAASLAIPIIVAAAPILKPLIVSLIHHVEVLFGHKTGPTKFDQVVKATLNAAEALATAGKLPGVLDPASVAMMVETEVQQLKATEGLTPETSAAILANPPAPKPAGPFSLSGTLMLKPA